MIDNLKKQYITMSAGSTWEEIVTAATAVTLINYGYDFSSNPVIG